LGRSRARALLRQTWCPWPRKQRNIDHSAGKLDGTKEQKRMNDARLGFQKSAAPAALKFPPASIDMKFELIGQQIQLRSNKDALQLHVNFQRAYEIAHLSSAR
jgi:hypothetical protein